MFETFLGLDLNTVWFILLGVLLTGYVILDGFDLGVGIVHLFGARTDQQRRIFLNSIGPVWDGNEVWLITGGGALFAAFPEVYATAFSGFYLAFMLLLCALIFRACSIEFRSKRPEAAWRKTWDIAFSVGSLLAAFLMGVAIGNVAIGIPLDADHEFAGTFLSLLNPHALLTGVMSVILFALHGSLYLILKTEGELQERMRKTARNLTIAFLTIFTIHTLATLLLFKHTTAIYVAHPATILVVMLMLACMVTVPFFSKRNMNMQAFLCSCGTIALLMLVLGMNLFPNLIYSIPNAHNSLTIYNAASSQKTLGIMLTIALIGMPFVIAYTSVIYYIFRGKVKLDKTSY